MKDKHVGLWFQGVGLRDPKPLDRDSERRTSNCFSSDAILP